MKLQEPRNQVITGCSGKASIRQMWKLLQEVYEHQERKKKKKNIHIQFNYKNRRSRLAALMSLICSTAAFKAFVSLTKVILKSILGFCLQPISHLFPQRALSFTTLKPLSCAFIFFLVETNFGPFRSAGKLFLSQACVSWQTDSDCWLRRGRWFVEGKTEIMLISAVGVRHFLVMLQLQLKSGSSKAWRGLKAWRSNGAAGDCIYYTLCVMSLCKLS